MSRCTANTTWSSYIREIKHLTVTCFVYRPFCLRFGKYKYCEKVRRALFGDITQRRVVILYRRFGTIYRFHWSLKMGRIRCPETSVKDYQSTLRKIPEERRFHQRRGGSLRSRIVNRRFEGPCSLHHPDRIRYVLGIPKSYMSLTCYVR
jgi:hypothetical protein